jgi:hypothetical protein
LPPRHREFAELLLAARLAFFDRLAWILARLALDRWPLIGIQWFLKDSVARTDHRMILAGAFIGLDAPVEREIRETADALYRRAEWPSEMWKRCSV